MRTTPDYPAAHSMDSTWYAVDADGEVAAFDTGEGGSAPDGGFPMGGEMGDSSGQALDDHELLAYALEARARTDERLRALLPSNPVELAEIIAEGDSWELMSSLLRSAGVWTYSCDEPVATPYLRQGDVARPLRLNDFAEALRRKFDRARLPVRFREAQAVAPGEHAPVHAWGPLWIDRAGRPHPTVGGKAGFKEAAAEVAGWDLPSEFEAVPAEALDDESFYEAVGRIVAQGTQRRAGSPSGTASGVNSESRSRGGLVAWLARLFRGG